MIEMFEVFGELEKVAEFEEFRETQDVAKGPGVNLWKTKQEKERKKRIATPEGLGYGRCAESAGQTRVCGRSPWQKEKRE